METESQNLETPASGSGTSIEKFKTAEDRDKAYVELEKFTYSQTERLADLEKKLENAMLQSRPAEQADNRSFAEMYPTQRTPQQVENELASRILTHPSQVLREHAEMVRQQTMREVNEMWEANTAIAQFKAENPTLAKHEDLVATFVRKQPANLSASERLKRGGAEASAYLANLVKGNNQEAPTKLDPNTYVESPTSKPSNASAAPAASASEEDDLSEMIRERAALQLKKRL